MPSHTGAVRPRVALMGGTLTLMPDEIRRIQYASSGVGTVRLVGAGMSTLLGPEGPEHSLAFGSGVN